MKTKWMRKGALLLAASIFMTQVSYFPTEAAEADTQIVAETEIETESTTNTDTEPEKATAEETVTEAETENGTVAETETESITEPDTESAAETPSESSIEMETETESELTTESETETETSTELETETMEESFENKGASLSGISFLFSDIRDEDDSLSEMVNTDDGKQAVYVFGPFRTCSRTAQAVNAISNCVSYYDRSQINMYAFDTSNNSREDLVSWLNSNNISQDIATSSIGLSISVNNFYNECTYILTASGGYPFIVYKGTDGTIYKDTAGSSYSESDICKNIEAGGISKLPNGSSGSVSLNAAYHTVDEVEAYMTKSGITGNEKTSYKRSPVTSGNYDPGELTSDTLDTALATLNQVRYIAGISSNITTKSAYNELCQAAALLNCVNGKLDHYPTQPSDMPDDLFQRGETGAKSSNLSMRGGGASRNFFSMIEGQLSDNSASNIDRLGHRRWLLNPTMEQTGFGSVDGSKGTFGAIYAIDNGSKTATIKVAWPAQTMPTTYFTTSDPWSVSVNEVVGVSSVDITLTRESDNKTWHFSESAADGYFNVDNGRYGQVGCIIFRPDMTEARYADGDLFHVDIAYNDMKMKYDVQFFEPYKSYSITYELNGGTNNTENPEKFRVFSDTIVLKDPVKEYSKFDGWYTDSGFKNKITQIDKGTNKNIKLYAKWKDTVTKVTLDPSSATMKEGETLQLKAQITADENISTLTWESSDENVASVSADGVVTAKSAGTAVITVTCYGKQAVCNVKVTGATQAPSSSVPTNTEVGKGTQITLTCATPQAVIRYTTDGSEPTAKSKIYKEPIVINADTTIKAYASSKENADSRIVTFVYTLKSFKVAFDTDGGSAVETLKVYQNDVAEEPENPVKEGYRFDGWYLAGKRYDFDKPVTADLTLKAVWKEYEPILAPTASLKSETTVEEGTRVSLLHTLPGVTIYYTTNGDTPTVKSAEYKNAIIIDKEMTIKAIAAKEGYKNSVAASFHYKVAEKGSLWGDVSPEDIPDSGEIPKGIWVKGIQDATYTGKAITHNIRVYDGSVLLVEKKDYTISYKNNVKAAKKTDAKAPTITISGKGNYNEKKTITFNINPKNINDSDVIADDITLAYTGKAKKTVPAITYNQKKLANNKDFTVTNPEDYSEARKYTIKVAGKGNYTGTRDIVLTVTKKILIDKASVSKIPNQIYDGKDKTPEITVKLKKELEYNKDYTLAYENNRAIGKASIIVKGKGAYAGTKRVTFNIVSPYKGGKYDIGEDKEKLIDVDINGRITFVKGGSTPAVRVSYDGKRLAEGKDYTVSYKDNKAAYTVSQKDAAVIITGKGSYCGKITKNFRINEKDLSETVLLINDKVYTGKAKGHITKFTLTDTDGKTLKAGTDYEKEVTYAYTAAVKLEGGESRKAGDAVQDTDIIPAGTTIKVTVKGTGSYTNTVTGEYRVIAKENDISKAKITLKMSQYYTGGRVEPDKNQFEVKLGDKILSEKEYTIVGYTNNIKKGNANVTIRGVGQYGGTKTVKFTISSKTVGTMAVK